MPSLVFGNLNAIANTTAHATAANQANATANTFDFMGEDQLLALVNVSANITAKNVSANATKAVHVELETSFATCYPVSYLFTKYHDINCYSHRFEVYAVKNDGYRKFRDKARGSDIL